MLTVSPLDEASLGTTESETVMVPTNTASTSQAVAGGDDGLSESFLSNEAQFCVVTNTSGRDSGVLILDGEDEEESAPSDDNGLQLSGADSVPTIVGSIDCLPTEGGGASAKLKFSAKEAKGSDFDDKPNPATIACTTEPQKQPEPVEPPTTTSSSSPSKHRLILVLVPTVALALLLPTIASFHFYKERNFLQLSVSRLAEEVLQLKQEAERKKREEELRWDQACQQENNAETILVNNCWLSAKANVQLGNCANDAKDSVKEFSLSLLQRLGNHSSWIDPFADDEEFGDSVARMVRKVDSLGKALWNATSTTTEEQLDSASKDYASFFSKMDVKGKSWFKESILNMFASSEEEESSKSKNSIPSQHSDSLEDVAQGISDIVAAAGTFSMVAGEVFMAKAVETTGEAMELNQTSMKDLLHVAKQAFEEASLARAADK